MDFADFNGRRIPYAVKFYRFLEEIGIRCNKLGIAGAAQFTANLEAIYLGQIGTFFLISGLAMIFGAMMTRFAVRLMGKKWSFIASLALVAACSPIWRWPVPY